RAPEKAFDGIFDRLGEAWRTNRRPFVLAGAAAWVAVLLAVLWAHENAAIEEETVVATPRTVAPKVSSLVPTVTPLAGVPLDAGPPATAEEAEAELATAV